MKEIAAVFAYACEDGEKQRRKEKKRSGGGVGRAAEILGLAPPDDALHGLPRSAQQARPTAFCLGGGKDGGVLRRCRGGKGAAHGPAGEPLAPQGGGQSRRGDRAIGQRTPVTEHDPHSVHGGEDRGQRGDGFRAGFEIEQLPKTRGENVQRRHHHAEEEDEARPRLERKTPPQHARHGQAKADPRENEGQEQGDTQTQLQRSEQGGVVFRGFSGFELRRVSNVQRLRPVCRLGVLHLPPGEDHGDSPHKGGKKALRKRQLRLGRRGGKTLPDRAFRSWLGFGFCESIFFLLGFGLRRAVGQRRGSCRLVRLRSLGPDGTVIL